jgi:two-component system, cell cycle response regulator CtrA
VSDLSLIRAQLAAVTEENAQLRERVRQLEADLQDEAWTLPAELRLTPAEDAIVRVLLKRRMASKETLWNALYAGRPGEDAAEIKIVDVFIHKLRKKLKPFGIEITELPLRPDKIWHMIQNAQPRAAAE